MFQSVAHPVRDASKQIETIDPIRGSFWSSDTESDTGALSLYGTGVNPRVGACPQAAPPATRLQPAKPRTSHAE